jgi:hypothetical protein
MLSIISFEGNVLSSEKKPSDCGMLISHANNRARATSAQKVVLSLGLTAEGP